MEQHGFWGEDSNKLGTTRDERLTRDREKGYIRLALGSVAEHGYYVFDEVLTESAGMLDYLALGPPGIIAILVRFDEGYVSRMRNSSGVLLDGKLFDDDPLQQLGEIALQLSESLTDGDLGIDGIVCLTRATFELDEERKPPLPTTPIWELPKALDPTGEEEQFTPADIEEIAEKIQRVYGRPPIVTPNRDRLWEGGF